MNYYCWASVDMYSLLPQNLGHVSPRTAFLLRQNFGISSCPVLSLRCLPSGPFTGWLPAGSLPALRCHGESFRNILLDCGLISTTLKQVGLWKSHNRWRQRAFRERAGARLAGCGREESPHCCLLFGIPDRQRRADQRASRRTPGSMHRTEGHRLCRKVCRF